MSGEVQFIDPTTPQGRVWIKMKSLGWRLVSEYTEIASSDDASTDPNTHTVRVTMRCYWEHNGVRRTQKQWLDAAMVVFPDGVKA